MLAEELQFVRECHRRAAEAGAIAAAASDEHTKADLAQSARASVQVGAVLEMPAVEDQR